jgi:putative ABC transport system permease protein
MNYLGQTSGNGAAGVYHPLAAGTSPVFIAVHVRADPAQFGPSLQSLAYDVDPLLRVRDVQPMDETNDHVLRMMGIMLRAASVVSAIALLLALAGIYSAVSFAVARRTREIGIRVALGAGSREVVLAIFRRPLAQVALGVLAGASLVAVFVHAGNGTVTARNVVTIALYAVGMMAVCLLACAVPTWRALRVEPTEALRGEG